MVLTLQRPEAVIFDMDGLLLDSERVALACFEQSACELGLIWSPALGLDLVGRSSRDSDRLLLAHYGADFPLAALRQGFDQRYDDAIMSGAIPLKPYARELLEQLDRMQIPCAVATSTQRFRAETKLAKCRLLSCFKALACGDEVTRGKPAPDIFELAATRLGVEPRDCLALEDSNPGVRAAVSASMPVVMVPDLVPPDADIRRYGVACVDSLKDVLITLSA